MDNHDYRGGAIWTNSDRTRHFIIHEDRQLPPGDLVLRTSSGRERSVDAASVARFEVSEADAQAWAKAELSATLGEMRGRVLSFADDLKARTARLREDNRRAWEEGVADAPPELREAAGKARSRLRDFGQALQRIARENLEPSESERHDRDGDPAANEGPASDRGPATDNEPGTNDDPDRAT